MENLSPLAILGSSLVFLFGVWKYLDTRKMEARNKRFDQFRQVSVWFSGRDENGNVLTAVQQTIATYQLAEFPEYKHMSLPIIEHMMETTPKDPSTVLFHQALQDVKNKFVGLLNN